MEFEFDNALVVTVGGYIYTIIPSGNIFKVQHRKIGGINYETDARHESIESAKEHVQILARDGRKPKGDRVDRKRVR